MKGKNKICSICGLEKWRHLDEELSCDETGKTQFKEDLSCAVGQVKKHGRIEKRFN